MLLLIRQIVSAAGWQRCSTIVGIACSALLKRKSYACIAACKDRKRLQRRQKLQRRRSGQRMVQWAEAVFST